MKRFTITILISAFVFLHIYCSSSNLKKDQEQFQVKKEFEIPKMALKLLADSTVDPCPVCVKKLQKKAYKILNEELIIGKDIIANSECGFLKTKECKKNEFVLSCYKEREEYKPADKDALIKFPLVIFKFYTEKDKLIGISENSLTEMDKFKKYGKMDNGAAFSGRIKIIGYEYGDGPSYNYNEKENTLLVHCKLIEII